MEYSIDKISQEINKLRDEAVLVEMQIATDPYASIELDLIQDKLSILIERKKILQKSNKKTK